MTKFYGFVCIVSEKNVNIGLINTDKIIETQRSWIVSIHNMMKISWESLNIYSQTLHQFYIILITHRKISSHIQCRPNDRIRNEFDTVASVGMTYKMIKLHCKMFRDCTSVLGHISCEFSSQLQIPWDSGIIFIHSTTTTIIIQTLHYAMITFHFYTLTV